MPTYSSPGNYVIEKDFSEYAPAVNSSIAGIVGFASKGPANKATLITSAAQLLRTFGETNQVSGGQGLIGALEILSRTNSVYYVRAENATLAAEASATVSWGACPAVQCSGIPSSSSITFNFSSTDETGTSNTPNGDGYVLAVTTGATDPAGDVLAAQAAIETGDWAWTAVSGTDPSTVYFVNTHAGKSASLHVSATGNQYSKMSVFDATGNATGVLSGYAKATGFNALTTDAGGNYIVESLYNGAGYNASTTTTAAGVQNYGIKAKVTSKAGKMFNFEVLNEGVVAEGFQMNFEQTAGVKGYFPEDVVNIGLTDNVSEYIKAQFLDSTGNTSNDWTPPTAWENKFAAGNISMVNSSDVTQVNSTPRFCKFIDGTYSLAGGVNGDAAGGAISGNVRSALLGSAAVKTGIHALDDDALNISMACVPGITEQNVQNELVTLAEASQNFLAVVSPPEGLTTPQQAVNWHNGQHTGRTSAINSSYAAVYWPWLKTFDVRTAADIYVDPAAYAVSIMCHTDSVSDPWFAPAGLTRGRLTKPTDVEVILNQGDRDAMYQPGNAVNPIAKFAQDGICIWGQRTAQRTPSSLDRVNVRRMMIVIRKMVLAATRAIVFEPNDPLTWNRVVNLLQPALDDIRRRRGITEFRVICDETTNTPLRIDRNEMWCRVLIKPTKTAEVLVFELNLTNQSANLGV